MKVAMLLSRYALAGAVVGLALGVGHAIDVLVPQDVHNTFSNLVKVSILVPLCAMGSPERDIGHRRGPQ